MIGKMKKVVVPTWSALSVASRDIVCVARAPGVRGYAEMASRLLLLSIILALPVIIFGKLIYLLDVSPSVKRQVTYETCWERRKGAQPPI